MKKYIFLTASVALVAIAALPASAHVVVKPNQVGVGERANFVVSVPTEEDTPTVQLRLVIPEGLKSVRPNVKLGWNIQLKKVGEGENTKITEIIWSGGRIPADQRDEFIFSGQAPAAETALIWKAYQTYGDGDVVAWENDPKMVEEFSKNNPLQPGQEDNHDAPRPYSETKVINDLKTSPLPEESGKYTSRDNKALLISLAALALAVVSLGKQLRKSNLS